MAPVVRDPSPGTLPVLPLRNVVLFPGVTLPVELGRASSLRAVRAGRLLASAEGRPPRIVVAMQKHPATDTPALDDVSPVGVKAEILRVMEGIPGRATAIVRGLCRVRLLDWLPDDGFASVRFGTLHEPLGDPALAYALAGALQDLVRTHDELLPAKARTARRDRARATIASETRPGRVADLVAAHVEIPAEDRFTLLEEPSVPERLRRLVEIVSRRISALQVQRELDEHVREHLSRHEQRALLRHKLRAIQAELGQLTEPDDPVQRLAQRLERKDLPQEVREAADRELRRLGRMHPQSNEAQVARTYLEWIADLPWGDERTEDRLDLDAVRRLLESRHHGMERAKKRIVEFLSVRKLAPGLRGPILCLAGPPGVGKTSLARSIAEAMGRRFTSISLGGVRDDAEIRGHRRTYVGALPGRILQAMKRVGTKNPVILLDEIDKLVAPDLRGDPAGALLEVLDPEQNATFEDHYLALPYDLSEVLFIATANDPFRIPGVLRDRLELLEMTGYTVEDKIAIARDHLWPRLAADHGLDPRAVDLGEPLVAHLVEAYTREAGVRGLRRALEALLRDRAMAVAEGRELAPAISEEDVLRVLGPPRYHPEVAERTPPVGLVAGLGWSPTGGSILFVEAVATPGEGAIRLTGRLGEVMRESGHTATSLVRSRAARFGIDPGFFARHDIHVHVPKGGVPKDGPSAGVTVTCALVSALSGRRVRPDVAMTGEVTLRGRVLPVGGIREKLVAAHRAGIRTVILPAGNRKDEPELPPRVREDLTLRYVEHIDDVLEAALLPAEDPAAA